MCPTINYTELEYITPQWVFSQNSNTPFLEGLLKSWIATTVIMFLLSPISISYINWPCKYDNLGRIPICHSKYDTLTNFETRQNLSQEETDARKWDHIFSKKSRQLCFRHLFDQIYLAALWKLTLSNLAKLFQIIIKGHLNAKIPLSTTTLHIIPSVHYAHTSQYIAIFNNYLSVHISHPNLTIPVPVYVLASGSANPPAGKGITIKVDIVFLMSFLG